MTELPVERLQCGTIVGLAEINRGRVAQTNVFGAMFRATMDDVDVGIELAPHDRRAQEIS